jgi:AraC-like DNA-binding protein
MDDPVVAEALGLIHDDPARPWTVASLAAKAGVSRATLARRFAARVGEPPMAYLAQWRIALAADLLRQSDGTVSSIARRVGYANVFALSVAFKRLRGVTPSEYRAG